MLTYDVLATSTFVTDPYLGEDRGYIVGTGVFLYVAGQVAHPVTVEIKLNPNWKSVASGLDPVSPANPHTLVAPDFDVLYDSPILMGNLESLPSFEIKGVPHYFIGFKLGNNFNTEQFIKNLKAVVEQGIAVVGKIPYKHYIFLGIGSGAGGIEHLNSTTVPFTGSPKLDTRAGTISTLNFLGHKYLISVSIREHKGNRGGREGNSTAVIDFLQCVHSQGGTRDIAGLRLDRGQGGGLDGWSGKD